MQCKSFPTKELKAGTWTDTCTIVLSNIIHNSQKVDTIQMFIRRMDKQIVAHTYKGILFSHKKQSTDTCDNMDEPWKY